MRRLFLPRKGGGCDPATAIEQSERYLRRTFIPADLIDLRLCTQSCNHGTLLFPRELPNLGLCPVWLWRQAAALRSSY
jgi:hypothetical protein